MSASAAKLAAAALRAQSDWDAQFYHDVMSVQQLRVAEEIFPHIPPLGDGLVVDAGCGSGLVAAAILRQHPHAHLLAVDLSRSMLRLARLALRPRFGERVVFYQGDLQDFCLQQRALCIFSNAALHWVIDHETMFCNLFKSLHPGGALVTQFACCAVHNTKLYAYLRALLPRPPFSLPVENLRWRVEAVNLPREDRALRLAGFADIHLEHHHVDFTFRTVEEHHSFMGHVVLRDYINMLPTEALKVKLCDAVLHFTDNEIGPLKQRYESLRCLGQRPPVSSGFV